MANEKLIPVVLIVGGLGVVMCGIGTVVLIAVGVGAYTLTAAPDHTSYETSPTVVVSEGLRSDDFVNHGPYTKPAIKNGRFVATRAFTMGKNKYPVEFSIDIPEGWQMTFGRS